MRKLIPIAILLIISIPVYSQKDKTIYLPETEEFLYPDLFIKAGIHSKIKATFDVVNLELKNLKLESLDSLGFEIARDVTKSNLDRLVFVNDTVNYSIIFDYVISKKISNNYIEYTEPGYIKAVFKWIDKSIREYISYSIECDKSTGVITGSWWVNTDKPIMQKSDILVELQFNHGKTEAQILKNNIPILESEIIKTAENIKKEFFEANDFCDDFHPIKYHLKFKVVRWFGKGNFSKVY